MSKEMKYINFNEEYELDYIAKQYEEKEEVKNELKRIAKEKSSKNISHDEIYAILKKLGYTKKPTIF
ncbi:hypothetical protein A0U20_07625 [Campylobacter lari]|uniref:hypothetical protein n=1 Tax=Campylobacter lari TaxID=201 RepID=UPI0017D3D8A1|nr:hypothetical protein [Campylobacter lari]EAI4298852.1 hypothetical protein [Campylobacter lari]MCV3440822.1 hypothetical protein [Campylobacter lari]MCW0186544.1 hypothetical protein [Campylobacter lari]HEC1751970.1 hypothetical protein [Campylobacter lari]